MAFKALSDAERRRPMAGSFRPLERARRGRGSDLRRQAEPAAHGFYFEVEVRAFDLMLRCLAPHMPDLLPAGNLGSILRDGDRRAPPGRRPALHRRRAAARRVGNGMQGARRQHRHLLRLRTAAPSTAPPRSPRRATASDVDQRGAQPGRKGGEGQLARRQGAARRLPGAQPTAPFITVGYTRSRIPPWGLAGGRRRHRRTIVRGDARVEGERERYALATGVIANGGDVIRIWTGNGAAVTATRGNATRAAIAQLT